MEDGSGLLTAPGRPSGTELLQVCQVCRAFVTPAETVHAVREVTLSAHAGQFVCIYGPSGSGKTTLLNLIAGLDVADSGRIDVVGIDVGALDEGGRARLRLETIGVVFQEHQLIDEFTACENVALPLEVRGIPPGSARAAALAELERVGLGGLGDRPPSRLSSGQRQRVGIARALVGQRRVLLADEPTGALDSANARALFGLIRTLCDQGTLAVVCTHDLLGQGFADAVYDLVDGRLTPRETAKTP